MLEGTPALESQCLEGRMQHDQYDATQFLIIRSEGMLSRSAEETKFTDQRLDVVAQVVQCKHALLYK